MKCNGSFYAMSQIKIYNRKFITYSRIRLSKYLIFNTFQLSFFLNNIVKIPHFLCFALGSLFILEMSQQYAYISFKTLNLDLCWKRYMRRRGTKRTLLHKMISSSLTKSICIYFFWKFAIFLIWFWEWTVLCVSMNPFILDILFSAREAAKKVFSDKKNLPFENKKYL